ncbi:MULTISPECIES: hypothetical protein [unclassified Neisseria]|nr:MULTISPECIES: hypothetical protein [unclassified Neisseria]
MPSLFFSDGLYAFARSRLKMFKPFQTAQPRCGGLFAADARAD